ncbi:MAG: hypothetical protein QM820_56365 [Minicystis sp.]
MERPLDMASVAALTLAEHDGQDTGLVDPVPVGTNGGRESGYD